MQVVSFIYVWRLLVFLYRIILDMQKNLLLLIGCSIFFMACKSLRHNYQQTQKFSATQLNQDFKIAEEILKNTHPSLYWYTPADSLEMRISLSKEKIQDSMTADEFQWKIIAPILHQIRCGHTSVSVGKAAKKWMIKHPAPRFPLHLKYWNDSLVVIANDHKQDTIFKRGTIILDIHGIPINAILKQMHEVLPLDGYASLANEVRISNRFQFLYGQLFGFREKYGITYLDQNGAVQTDTVHLFDPKKKSGNKSNDNVRIKRKNQTRKKKIQKIEQYRSINFDSSGLFATMKLNSFQRGRLHGFFHKSFKVLADKKIPNLILDLRSNGGGYVHHSTRLTRYISRKPFRVADSAYASVRHTRPYWRYFNGWLLQDIGLRLMIGARRVNHFPAHSYERKWFKPMKKNHFDGQVYVLISGPTFSASTLFANAIKAQPGITLVGEETGGGHYGNSGIIIPTFTLPNTRLQIRYPLFRLVQLNHQDSLKGKGIQPDWYIPTNYDAIMKGYDYKMKSVRDKIISENQSNQ